MTQFFFARIFSVLTLMMVCQGSALAQSKKSAIVKKSAVTAAPSPVAVLETTPAPIEAPKTNWKFSYYGEYQGPRFSNIDLLKTQGNSDANPSYTEIDHSLKLGYAVAKFVVLGTQVRAVSPLNPAKSFNFADLRFYGSWNHMIETQDVDMQGQVKLELPTTDKSRISGKIFAVSADFNWTLKTALRNWTFSVDTLIKPYFFNDPVSGGGKTNLVMWADASAAVDLAPGTQLLFEGFFDATHNYNASLYDFQSGDADYITVGPTFTIGSHVNTNVAMRFFTDSVSFKTSVLFANISWAL